jgi:acyl-homoserine lactone acylase PvdQ
MAGRSLPRPRPLLALVALVGVLVGGAVVPASAAPGGGQAGRVRILRDEYGVPHLYAASLSALFHGVGYAQGQDRLWQADIHRRLGTGTLSDLLGPDVLPGDVVARQLFGSRARRAALFAQASPLTRTVLASFTEGMNAWIRHAEQTHACRHPTPPSGRRGRGRWTTRSRPTCTSPASLAPSAGTSSTTSRSWKT